MNLLQKLRIDLTKPLLVIGAGEAELEWLSAAQVITKPDVIKMPPLQVFLFVKDKKTLDKEFGKLIMYILPDTLLWIAYPKKSGSIPSDLVRDAGWESVFSSDWQPVTGVALNEDWSTLRFRHRSLIKTMKRIVPMEERSAEGVDYINREVALPEDVTEAMKDHKDLESFFYSLSFTHQKEHAEAIATAKKPETRARRIKKMIEMLTLMKQEKQKKK
ncbi:MAG TPA: YdeI/OmpD-associated family protein [Flavipsychrobacter sp.]|nr:YdeI/OmpD-associated family protein [Flavipsychrobacter sp.]